MNPKTTLVLFVLALALGAGWYFTRGADGSGGSGTRSRTLFPDLVESKITALILEDPLGEVWPSTVNLRRATQGWHMITRDIADGLPVRARSETVRDLLAALKTLTPLRTVEDSVNEAHLARLGLAPAQRRRIVLRSDDDRQFQLELGATGPAFDVMVRVGEAGPVYSVAKEILNSLQPPLAALEDAAVFAVSPLSVTSLAFQVGESPRFRATREFSRWFITHPFAAPGDSRRLEELRNRLLNARIMGRRDPQRVSPQAAGKPFGTLSIEVSDGAPIEARLFSESNDQFFIAVDGEPSQYAVDPGLRAEFVRPFGDYREREWIPINPSEIRELRLTGPHRLHLALTGSHQNQPVHEVLIPSSKPGVVMNRGTDPVRLGNFLENLRKLGFDSYQNELEPFTPEWTLEVFGPEGQADLVYEIGGASHGRCLARRKDEKGGGVVAAAALEGILVRSEDLLELYAQGLLAYFQLAELEVKAPGGEPVKVRGSVSEGKDWAGEIVSTQSTSPLPASLSKDLVTRLVRLPVREHRSGGESSPIEASRLSVRYFVAEGATQSGIPANPQGRWHELRVGPAGPDGISEANLDTDPPQRFSVDQRSLQPFFDLLRTTNR